MSGIILDGKAVSQRLRQQIKSRVNRLREKGQRAPGLAVVIIGEDPASQIYVNYKRQACRDVGFESFAFDLPVTTSEDELLALIQQLNQDESVDGILVQLPLPAHLSCDRVIDTIAPEKDVDGFHPVNLGSLAQRRPRLRPCTPKGIMHLLEEYSISLKSKHVVVVGASNIVGRPMALECLLKGATVTVAHRFTHDLASHIANADVVISAMGKPGIIDSNWFKPGVIIVDVAINRQHDGRLIGDIDFASAQTKATYITPVPGGVGPMTIASLLENTLQAYLG